MSLAVEVAGFGLCQITSPYSLLVICVQQESFQAWTVYRRYDNFLSLLEQLRILHPSVPNVPAFNPNNLSLSNLDGLRFAMDSWWINMKSRTASSCQHRLNSQNKLYPVGFGSLHQILWYWGRRPCINFSVWMQTCLHRILKFTGGTGMRAHAKYNAFTSNLRSSESDVCV